MNSKTAKLTVATVIIIAAVCAALYFSVFSGSGHDPAPKVATKPAQQNTDEQIVTTSGGPEQVKEAPSKGVVKSVIMQPVLPQRLLLLHVVVRLLFVPPQLLAGFLHKPSLQLQHGQRLPRPI